MSKVKEVKPQVEVTKTPELEVPAPVSLPTPVVPFPMPAPALPTKLGDVDKLNLDLAKARNQAAVAEAKAAVAEAKTAELSFRYTILQIYMAYGLTSADAISDAGDIIRGGALPQQPGQ